MSLTKYNLLAFPPVPKSNEEIVDNDTTPPEYQMCATCGQPNCECLCLE